MCLDGSVCRFLFQNCLNLKWKRVWIYCNKKVDVRKLCTSIDLVYCRVQTCVLRVLHNFHKILHFKKEMRDEYNRKAEKWKTQRVWHHDKQTKLIWYCTMYNLFVKFRLIKIELNKRCRNLWCTKRWMATQCMFRIEWK